MGRTPVYPACSYSLEAKRSVSIMRISRLATYAVSVLAAAALIAGCSSNGSGMQPSASAPNSLSPSGHGSGGMMPLHRGLKDTFIGVKRIGKVHTDHHKSWV